MSILTELETYPLKTAKMIKFEQFKEIIDLLEVQYKKDVKFSTVMEDYLDGHFVATLNTDLITAFHALVNATLEHSDEPNKSDMNWIEWYMYETNFGENPMNGIVDGEMFEVKNVETLYQIMTKYEQFVFKKFEQYNHNSKEVWVNSHLRGMHKQYCLCNHCAKFKPDSNDNCEIAEQVFTIDKQFGIATPVWECPEFNNKNISKNGRKD